MKIKKIGSIVLTIILVLTLFTSTFSTLSVFADDTANKQMLHLTPTSTNPKFGINLPVASVTAGEYVVQFKYKFTNGQLHDDYKGAESNPGAVFAVYNRLGNANLADNIKGLDWTPICWEWSTANGTNTRTDLNANTVQYTFSITEEHIKANKSNGHWTHATLEGRGFFIGFYTPKSADFYIADMVMYKSGDTAKTNILPDYLVPTSWRLGINQTQKYEGTLMSYDADLIGDNQMLHLKTTENSRTGVKVDMTELDANTNYTVRFDYKFNEGNLVFGKSSLANSVQFAVYSNQYDNTNLQTKMQYVSALNDGVPGNDYTFKNIDGNTVEFIFNTSFYQGSTKDYYYIGFVGFKGTCDFYISNMVMYATADTEKKNLLPEDEISTNWCNMVLGNAWTYNGNKLPTGSAYMAYDETCFAEAEVTLGDGNGVEGIDIRDLVELNKVVTYKIYNINYDINKDGNVTDADLPLLRNHLLGIELIA